MEGVKTQMSEGRITLTQVSRRGGGAGGRGGEEEGVNGRRAKGGWRWRRWRVLVLIASVGHNELFVGAVAEAVGREVVWAVGLDALIRGRGFKGGKIKSCVYPKNALPFIYSTDYQEIKME